jgi:3-oxoacyl-[acyl-carrier-protein] synthase III
MKAPVRVSALSVVPGEIEISLGELAILCGTSEAAVKSSLGEMHVYRTERPVRELALEAARAALTKRDIPPNEVDLVLTCSIGDYDHFRGLTAQLGHPRVPLIQLVGTCGVVVQAIDVARCWLSCAGGGRALVVYADVRDGAGRTLGDISTGAPRTLISDGATAVVVESGTGLSVLGYGVAYDVRLADLYAGDTRRQLDRADEMQAVINSIKCARTALTQALAEAGVTHEEVRWFIHPLEAEAFAELVLGKLRVQTDRRLTNPTGVAHPLAADALFQLHDALARGRIGHGDTIAVVARGISSVHCVVLRQD